MTSKAFCILFPVAIQIDIQKLVFWSNIGTKNTAVELRLAGRWKEQQSQCHCQFPGSYTVVPCETWRESQKVELLTLKTPQPVQNWTMFDFAGSNKNSRAHWFWDTHHTLVLSGVQYNRNSLPSIWGIDGCVSSLVSEIPYSVILSCQVLTVILCFWICIYICIWFATVSLDVTCICFMLCLQVYYFYISCCIPIWDHVPPN